MIKVIINKDGEVETVEVKKIPVKCKWFRLVKNLEKNQSSSRR